MLFLTNIVSICLYPIGFSPPKNFFSETATRIWFFFPLRSSIIYCSFSFPTILMGSFPGFSMTESKRGLVDDPMYTFRIIFYLQPSISRMVSSTSVYDRSLRSILYFCIFSLVTTGKGSNLWVGHLFKYSIASEQPVISSVAFLIFLGFVLFFVFDK